ncbi:gametogenetin-binding protein 2-like [Clytia hemisphaerica]
MAKLVAVCRDEEFPFERRQIPLMIEETLTMVMEIPETVISAECVTSENVAQFVKKYSCLTHGEMAAALMVRQKDLFSLLSVSVPCVGCRRSVERLYNQLYESGQPALEPLTICSKGVLTLSASFLKDAKLIYALFYIHGTHLNDVVDTIPKSKRNKRCILHSLETHKAARASGWMDVWDLLSQECRDEVVLIDSDSLLDTLETYLRKHRFCSECKSKVLKAYSILAGDTDGDSEKGYCATLYEGLKSCPKERHIHVVCDTDFIAHLIGRAEPELAGGRRERHARTIDIAQEEVLTCLGIHLWERLHRLWQKLRAEEQTWQILFYLGVEALRKRFETAVEEKQGISQLELVVEEISVAEKAKEQKRENKRLKRKKRKENKAKVVEESKALEEEDEEEKSSKCTDGDEKENLAVNGLDIDDCSSEKSSTDSSQASPGKSDQRSASPLTPSKLSPCSSLSDSSFQGLLKPVDECPATQQNDEKPAVCPETPPPCTESPKESPKCSTKKETHVAHTPTKSTNNKSPTINKKSPTNNKTPTKKCSKKEDQVEEAAPCKDCDKEAASSPPWVEAGSRKKCQRHSQDQHQPLKGSTNTRGNTNKDCECDSTNANGKQYKRNGYYNGHQERGSNSVYKNGHYTNNKRNGYNDCRSSQSVGPRFSRYENQNRLKEQQQQQQQQHDSSVTLSTADSSCSNGSSRGRGTGKRGGKHGVNNSKENSPSILTNSQWGNQHHNNHQTNGTTTTQHHQQQQLKVVVNNTKKEQQQPISKVVPSLPKNGGFTSPEVEDENELRLLKSMGWNHTKHEDSFGLSEQEIQEFKASKVDVQSRRQELRNKLRDQFQKLCINHEIPCRVCNVVI